MSSPAPKRTPRPLPFDRPRFCCEEAERFSGWVDALVARLTKDGTKDPSVEQMWEAKAKLLDEYRKERNGATRQHRDRLKDKDGDPCVHGVFVAAMDRLAAINTPLTISSATRRKPADQAPPAPRERSAEEAMIDALRKAW